MIITNVKLVLADTLIEGSVDIQDGKIRAFADRPSQLPQAIDGEGGWLLPGLIELHTDNLEKHFTPRPKVSWPPYSAMAAHDTQLIGVGITTVLDAIAVGDERDGGTRKEYLDKMFETVLETERLGVNRAEHLLHIRCELAHSTTVELARHYSDNPAVRMLSLMDHSPGQRQFVNPVKYREYYQGKYGLDDAQMAAFDAEQRELSAQWAEPNRQAIAALGREKGIALASHDDATAAHVEQSHQLGLVLAEFPTTIEAARRSHELGLKVMMGAPNIVRGGSHSGNVAAHELAALGVLDVLSSDYFPGSLLDGLFRVADDPRNTLDLPAAVQLASLNPAEALGLADRGEIAEGKRADLVLVQKTAEQPYVRQVWREGRRVF